MSASDVAGPLNPSARQCIFIFVCTKLRFQSALRRCFGETRLAAINASVDPFIFPYLNHRQSFDVYIFILI